MALRFSKENMPTAAVFVRDSFLADQADFVAVAPADFGPAFAADLQAKVARVAQATGGALRTGAGTGTTARLYGNLDALRPLLDRLDIRLGLLPASALAVPAKSFGLKRLRERLDARDVEAVSKALTVLQQAIADTQPALASKGYTAQELADLTALHTAIDAENAAQNTHLNASTTATQAEDADYKALDALLGTVLRTGRLLYKANKPKRRQYEIAAIMQRLHAAAPLQQP
jgi:hypothetical protein